MGWIVIKREKKTQPTVGGSETGHTEKKGATASRDFATHLQRARKRDLFHSCTTDEKAKACTVLKDVGGWIGQKSGRKKAGRNERREGLSLIDGHPESFAGPVHVGLFWTKEKFRKGSAQMLRRGTLVVGGGETYRWLV